MSKWGNRAYTALGAFALYTWVSCFAWALRNPHKTNTEMLIGIWEALTWK